MCCKIEKIFVGGSEFIRCRRIYILTPVGMDVKDGEAVHFTLDIRKRQINLYIKNAVSENIF